MDIQTIGAAIGILVGILTIFEFYKKNRKKKIIKEEENTVETLKAPEVKIVLPEKENKNVIPSPVTLSFMQMMKQGKYQEAIALAPLERERLTASLSAENPEMELELDDFDVWHARALMYIGQTELAMQKQDMIISQLEGKEDNSHRRLRKDLILGMAHNDKGYASWMILGHYQAAIREFKVAIEYFARHNKQGDQLATACDNLGRVYSQLGHRTKAELLIEHGRKIRANLVENKNNRYALSLISSGITCLCYGDPYRAMELSSEALRWFSGENKRGQGLAYIIQGQSQRYIGSSWKYKSPEDQHLSREYLEKSLSGLREAEVIFSTIVKEPIRLQDAYNEIGCTYRELSLLEAANRNENEAIKMAETAHEMLEKSVSISRKNNYEIAYIDGCEDMARLYKNYAELDPDQSKDWMEKAQGMLKEAEGVIAGESDYYMIRKNKPSKSTECENPVEEFWQHLGKIHILRGHLIFDAGNKSGGYFHKRSRRNLVNSLENYILAMGYFGRFLRSAEDGVSERLTTNSLLMNHRYFSKELYERLRLLDSATMREVNEEILPKIVAEYDLENIWTDWLYKDILDLITQIHVS